MLVTKTRATPLGLARNIGGSFLDLLYPRQCALCGKWGEFLCQACHGTLPVAEGDRCQACWQPVFGQSCLRCRDHPLRLSGLRSPFAYKEGARRLVLAFKFHGLSALAPVLAAPMADLAARFDASADALVPVPLSGRRERERGFNQARLLAREVGRRLGAPVAEPLRRVHSRRLQSESRREQRFQNVEGAFALRSSASVTGKRLVLIDDVATTCATVDACARVLLEAGAAEIAALTFARED